MVHILRVILMMGWVSIHKYIHKYPLRLLLLYMLIFIMIMAIYILDFLIVRYLFILPAQCAAFYPVILILDLK